MELCGGMDRVIMVVKQDLHGHRQRQKVTSAAAAVGDQIM